ncbi:MAG TPA: murein biosynthesis integral membrane protein MurJ [Verrucomicrobiales bacterium]|nr:murein biosynthesis integral membrane protein MurJ [Verrucomicrobiales bacterium]
MGHFRSLATVSGFTAVSRVLGFVRDILISRFVGANMVTEAFFTAFRFPNMFRRVFGEGAFNSAFVPLFGRRLEENGREDAFRFASQTFSLLALILGLGTLVAIPAMPALMSVVAPGFKARYTGPEWSRSDFPAASQPLEVDVRGAKEVYLTVRLPRADSGARPVQILWTNLRLTGDQEAGAGAPSEPVEIAAARGSGEELPGETASWQTLDDAWLRVALPGQHRFTRLRAEVRPDAAPGWDGLIQVQAYGNHPETFRLTVLLSRITFCYLLFMALAAHLSGVLNTMQIFGMPAAAPILLNIVFIIGLTLFIPFLGYPGEVLAWCVAVAGAIQLAALWFTCRRKGFPVRLQRPHWSPAIKRLFLLMGPGIASAGIQQINLLVGGIIASFQQGAVTYLYYSDRVYQLPLGMIGIAFGVVLLPDITRKLRSGRDAAALASLNRGIEFSLLLTLPAAVALSTVALPIISVLFEGGRFSRDASVATAQALAGFAIGLPGYVLVKVLQPGYFARENTATPMLIAAVTVAVNIACSVFLFWILRDAGLGHLGIAIGTSTAAWVNVALLYFGLRRSGFFQADHRLRNRLWRIALASLLMGAALSAFWFLTRAWLDGPAWQRLLQLGLLLAIGICGYAALALGLRATGAAEFKTAFRRS